MLSYPALGALSLVALWVAALLILATAAADRRRLAARLAWLEGRAGRGAERPLVLEATIDAETLAEHVLEERGRARVGVDSILLHARARRSRVFGGAVTLSDGRRVALPAFADDVAEVWASDPRAAAAEPALDFGAAHAEARRTRGLSRTTRFTLGRGQRVYLVAALQADGQSLVAAPTPDPSRGGAPTLLVSSTDPRRVCREADRLARGVMAGMAAGLVACTALALVPPWFEGWSTLGGLLGLAYFLGVQPVGVWLHERLEVLGRPANERELDAKAWS
jgi:hypothetical protein